MKRRTMIKILGSGLALPSLANLKNNRAQKRGATKKLLVIFQRGGNDGLNTLVPISGAENQYYRNLRPDIYINTTDTLSVPNSSFFGMHQGMRDIRPVMNNGHLSWVHAVGYPNPNRSHFESQAFYETGIPGNSSTAGWLNRYLQLTTGAGLIRGIAISNTIPLMMSGSQAVPVSRNFGNLEIAVDSNLSTNEADDFRNMLSQTYGFTPTLNSEEVYGTGQKVFQMIENFSSRDANAYLPENGAAYPNTDFGSKVRHAAQMLKDDPTYLGIELVSIDQDGFDTHARQVDPGATASASTTHSRLLADLSSSLMAFYTDLGQTRMQDVLVLVVSEFGRRAYQNDSFGTDHGTGSLVMVMGKNVSGLAHNGDGGWPGLSQANLYGGDLDWATDYRDIYWEILSRHMGVSNGTLAQILPGHSYSAINVL